jgi:hypothetical protein
VALPLVRLGRIRPPFFIPLARPCYRRLMASTFLYRCPNTGQTVQGWSAEEVSDQDDNGAYQSVDCLACARVHLINIKTGKVLRAGKRIEDLIAL